MSNSPLVTYTRITNKRTHPRRQPIDTITIHCFVGQVTAKRGVDFFATTDREASTNYVVGCDGSIGLSVPEEDRAWTTGGTLSVNGITGSMNDQRAVTIEVASDTKPPCAITDAAMKALLDLLTDICQRNGIKALLWSGDKDLVGKVDQQNMTVHRWFAKKACPGDYLYDRHGEIAAEVNRRLKAAEGQEGEEAEVRYNEIAEMPDYARPTIRKMVDKGFIGGAGTGKKDADGRPADLDLSIDMIRVFVTNDRAGLYGN